MGRCAVQLCTRPCQHYFETSRDTLAFVEYTLTHITISFTNPNFPSTLIPATSVFTDMNKSRLLMSNILQLLEVAIIGLFQPRVADVLKYYSFPELLHL